LTANHNSEARETDLLKMQLSIYIDLYKHHYDLFLKAAGIYLAVVSVLAGYMFRADVNFVTKCALSTIVSIAALIGFLGGRLYKEWLTSTEISVGNISDKLGIAPVVFIQTKKVITIEQVVSVLLFAASLLNTVILLIRR
jgi:hypothetical protein